MSTVKSVSHLSGLHANWEVVWRQMASREEQSMDLFVHIIHICSLLPCTLPHMAMASKTLSMIFIKKL